MATACARIAPRRRRSPLETRMRVQGAAVTALVGAVATAMTAAATGLDTPLGWGMFGLIIGGLCGY